MQTLMLLFLFHSWFLFYHCNPNFNIRNPIQP